MDYTVKIKEDKVKIIASSGYYGHITGKSLATMKDTGNGYIIKFKSFSSVKQDNYLCMDYSESEYLYSLLKTKFENKNSSTEDKI